MISILLSFWETLLPQMQQVFVSWCNFISSFVNGNIFFFSKSIKFLECPLKDSQNLLILCCTRYLHTMSHDISLLNIHLFLLLKNFQSYLHIHLCFYLKISPQHKYCMAFYPTSHIDYIPFLMALQFHKSLYFYLFFHEI